MFYNKITWKMYGKYMGTWKFIELRICYNIIKHFSAETLLEEFCLFFGVFSELQIFLVVGWSFAVLGA